MIPQIRTRKAFSLIELLAVIAIGAILVALGANMMKNVGTPNPGNVARQVSALIQLASSESRAKSMPVWMGIGDLKEGKDHNLVLLAMTADTDANGVPDWNTKRPLGKPERFGAVQVPTSYSTEQKSNPARAGANDPDDETKVAPLPSAPTGYPFKFDVAGKKDLPFDRVLQFSPSGSITLPPGSFPSGDVSVIEIYIQPMRGDVAAPGKNTAVVQIQTLTGTCRVVQPDKK